ncbi:YwhD family protein [Salibacterium lacus]|uniref:YwhD family protein n=1 Tax=Salibacterium lacus TaxID=1898109 RepID=A0ABW5T6X6_9BACI
MDLFDNEDKKRKGGGFNILSGDATGGDGGYGAGTLSLDNMTPVIIDPAEDRAFIDMGALHARSEIEKKVKFSADKEDVPEPKLYWLVWVTVDHKDGQPCYTGVGACETLVENSDKRIRKGYKSMPEHVNNMDKSMKGKLAVDHMDDHSKYILGEFLKGFSKEYWDHSGEELHQALNIKGNDEDNG